MSTPARANTSICSATGMVEKTVTCCTSTESAIPEAIHCSARRRAFDVDAPPAFTIALSRTPLRPSRSGNSPKASSPEMTGCPTGATETTPWISSFPIPESSTASMHVSKMMSQLVRSGIRAVGTSPIPTIAISLTPLPPLQCRHS